MYDKKIIQLKMSCQVLPVNKIDEAAKLMADAFSNSPGYTFIFQHDAEYRRKALEWLFQRNLILIQRRCPSSFRGVLDESDKLIACFLWTHSSHANISTWDMIKAGMWQIPFRFGTSTLSRLLYAMEHMDQGELDCFQDCVSEGKDDSNLKSDVSTKSSSSLHSTNPKPFVRLERMAVHTDYQGKGLGSKVLRSVISETKIPMRLETQEQRNVRFYERVGYRVVGEVKACEDDDMYMFTSWFMTRDADAITDSGTR